jgi:tetratricopeptide (TPR) repeat protein
MESGWNEKTLNEAKRLLESGIKIIGDNALLFSSLANVYLQSVRIWVKEESELTRAEAYAKKALELDPEIAHAYMVLGLIKLFSGYPKDFFQLLRKSLTLDPNDLETIMWGSWLYILAGRKTKAVGLANRMTELDPLTWRGFAYLAVAHAYNGQFELAIDITEKEYPIEHQKLPYTRFWLSFFLVYANQSEKALELLDPIERKTEKDLYVVMCRILRYALKGDKNRAVELSENQFKRELQRDCVVSLMIAEVYVILGEIEQAFDWLENAVNWGFINYPYLSEHNPLLKKLRSKPRFKKLMERVKHEWESVEI